MAYAFKGNSFKSYHFRPLHWVGSGSTPPPPVPPTVGRSVSIGIPSGGVSASIPSGSVPSRVPSGSNVSVQI